MSREEYRFLAWQETWKFAIAVTLSPSGTLAPVPYDEAMRLFRDATALAHDEGTVRLPYVDQYF